MTFILATIFAIALCSLLLGGYSYQRKPYKKESDDESQSSSAPKLGSLLSCYALRVRPASPLSEAIKRTERYGRPPPLPIEDEISRQYGGYDIPHESLEFPARPASYRQVDEIPF